MPSGGRRRGAGAPAGNLNALRSGRRSKQLKTLVIALMAFPQTRNILLRLNRMERRDFLRLRDAVSRYARLLQLPSRERSIKSIQTKPNLNRAPFFKNDQTIRRHAAPAPRYATTSWRGCSSSPVSTK